MKPARLHVVLFLMLLVISMIPSAVFAEAICDSFTVTPDTATPGDFVTLDWVTTNTISVEIDVLGTVATSGSALYEVPNTPGVVSINLTAFDENIFEAVNAVCSVNLTIEAPPTCDSFLALPDTIDGPGDVRLEWLTSGATTVSIDNGIGFMAEDGDQTVTVSTSTTYTLTAVNTFGTSTCAVPVTVNPVVPVVTSPPSTGSSNSGGGKSIKPRCEVSVDANEVEVGDTVIVSWNSSNARVLSLRALESSQSNILLSTSSTSVVKNGSFPYKVTSDTTFTIEVARPNRTANCSASVVVKPDGLGGTGLGDTTGLISLASVPVTGFDPTFGFIIILNVFLAFGAIMGAYILVVFWQQYGRATDRSFADTHIYTPLHALFSQERRSLHSRILLWKWCALAVSVLALFVYLIR